MSANTLPTPPDPEDVSGATARSARKRGAPGNRNALVNGRASYFITGRLPAGAGWIHKCVLHLRRAIEAAVLASGRDVGLYESALIQSATRHEARALLCQRWLRVDYNNMSVDQRLGILKEAGNASDKRDQCLQKLGLDRSQMDQDLIVAPYRLADERETPLESSHTTSTQNASDGVVCDSGGCHPVGG